jgi:hypothetical protein
LKKVFTNIHQSFWVHCLTKTICPHDMAHFNYIKVVSQGRFIDFWNTYFSRYVREATYLFVRSLYKFF